MGKPNKIGRSIKINHLETQQLQAQSEEELDRVRGGLYGGLAAVPLGIEEGGGVVRGREEKTSKNKAIGARMWDAVLKSWDAMLF